MLGSVVRNTVYNFGSIIVILAIEACILRRCKGTRNLKISTNAIVLIAKAFLAQNLFLVSIDSELKFGMKSKCFLNYMEFQ